MVGKVTASIWAEDYTIGMVLFRKVGKVYQPLDQWKSSLSAFSFGFVEILENWKTEHNLIEAVMNLPSDYRGQSNRHPIKNIIPVRTTLKPEIELIEGLACLYYLTQNQEIDFSHYNQARLMEQVRRLDANRDPVVLAFLQAVTQPAASGVGVSRRKPTAPA